MMAVQQFIKIRAIPVSYTRRLRHVAIGCLQQLNQILLFKLTAGL